MEQQQLSELLKSATAEPVEYLKSLPGPIKKRVKALKKLQTEGIKLEAKFYERVHQLEMEFAPLFAEVNQKRKAIVIGEHEPTDQEADFPLLQDANDDEFKEMENLTVSDSEDRIKGIPDFWLHTLKNVDHIREMIQEHDEPILKHLIDVTCNIHTDPNAYTLTFHFEPNEYFKQTQLTKHYVLQMEPDADDVFDYDGPVVVSVKGTEIEWNEGKNVTKKIIKKKQKRVGGACRFVTKSVQADSFFNFFEPPLSKQEGEADDSEDDGEIERELLQADFEIGQLFRDQIVHRAVLFYTGELTDEADLYEDFDEGDEVEDEGDNDFDDE